MKKVKFLIIFVLIGSLTWYLFIKPYDYTVTFNAKTSPGTLFSNVEEWNLLNQKIDSFTYNINDKKAFTFIKETLKINDKSLDITWGFKSINDSTTHVTVGVTEKEKSIYNRLTIPFLNTPFEEIVINTIKDYKKGIEYQLKNKTKVKLVGIDSIPEITYA